MQVIKKEQQTLANVKNVCLFPSHTPTYTPTQPPTPLSLSLVEEKSVVKIRSSEAAIQA